MDQRVRKGIPEAEGVPGQSASVVQPVTGYSTSSVLRSYRTGEQFGPCARAGLGTKANLLC